MSDLRVVHIDVNDHNNTGKIIAAIVVAAGVIGLGVYTYDIGMWQPASPASPVSDSALPNPGLPVIH